ncbi:MAG: hypothetical protein ABS899_02455 [Desemzia incerta]
MECNRIQLTGLYTGTIAVVAAFSEKEVNKLRYSTSTEADLQLSLKQVALGIHYDASVR